MADFQLSRACDLDLEIVSGHTVYRRASLNDLYLKETFCGRTYVRKYARMDGYMDI